MSDLTVLERALKQIVYDLRPYLADVVIIGGWVPYLHREYGGFHRWNGRLALTSEVDVLVPSRIASDGRASVAEILQEAGFRPMSISHPAVWVHDPEHGERIEFLVPHRGMARTEGQAVPVQSGLAAIALERLDVLSEHTSTLSVPVSSADGRVETLPVRVPTLGAYVVNKATTFLRRAALGGGATNPKLAKDLLYLRDLAAAGEEVIQRIHTDLVTIGQSGPRASAKLGLAANQIGLAMGDHMRPRLREVAAMMVERDHGLSPDAALADVEGYLTDLAELFGEIIASST